MSIIYQDKLSRLLASLVDVITCLHHVSTMHFEITNKIKLIRAIGIKSRVKELEKVNQAFSSVEEKAQEMLKITGCKSYVSCSKNSIEAEHNHTLRNKKFEEESRNVFFHFPKTACSQMLVKLLHNNNLQCVNRLL